MSSEIQEMTDYGVRGFVEHLVLEESYGGLFELLEKRDFLARQAGILGSFRQGSSDLETYALKVAIAQGDWPRFLRHATVAANLRGLAEALADEEILGALVANGQEVLAADIVEQVTDPQSRLRARAIVVGARRRRTTTSAVDEGSARLVDELDAVAPPSGEAEARTWLRTLRTVARHLGSELRDHWGRWIARLAEAAPELADDAWSAVVESWIGRDLGPGSGLWPALAKMAPERVREILPRRLAASPLAGPTLLEEPLPPPFDDRRELLHDVRLALLAAGVVEDPSPFLPSLRIDSVERVELGRDLWPRLREEPNIDDPAVRAAFRVVVLEGLHAASETKVDADAEKAALASLSDLPEPVRLHWTLRCLMALAPSQERRRHVRTVARLLYARRYEADAQDLARFLDLVAKELGMDLSRVLPNVVAAPSSQVERLRALARRCRRQEVLEELWKNAERYAAAASRNDAEGFQLRSEVLSLLAGRLCVLGKDLKTYKETLERLLPEEEDPLRLAVIDELVDGDGEWRRQLALEVCGDFRSRRLALRTRLRLSSAGEDLGALLQPASLYEAVAGNPAVADELTALAPLLKLPERAEERQGLFLEVADSDRRILALLDLARHDLAYQRRAYPLRQHDPIAALQPLSRAVGNTTSDDRLAALTPELVELGCRVSPSRAVAELQEAVFRLLRLKEVSWPLRAEALGRILRHVEDWVLGPDGLQGRSRRRAVVAFFRWIARLPSLPELAEEELQDVWPRLLPIVLSAFGRLPAERQAAIRRHPLHPFDRWLPRALVKRTSGAWAEGVAGFASWAPAEILTSCFVAGDPPSDVGEGSLVESSLPAIGDGELDPLDARSAPLRRALWELDGENGCAPFADAVVRALTRAGRAGGEQALCFWVHSWVRPRLGREAPEGGERLAALKAALRQAETIPGPAGAPS